VTYVHIFKYQSLETCRNVDTLTLTISFTFRSI